MTADGELRTVSADQHPDLYWALRGGKGGFGVVTSATVELIELATIYGGGEYYPALLVELALRGACEEVPLHHARALGERIEAADPLGMLLPRRARVRVEAPVETAGDEDTVLERRPVLGRQGEAVLVVEGMFMLTEQMVIHCPPL